MSPKINVILIQKIYQPFEYIYYTHARTHKLQFTHTILGDRSRSEERGGGQERGDAQGQAELPSGARKIQPEGNRHWTMTVYVHNKNDY